jgi:ABC-2 type transport system permease protein
MFKILRKELLSFFKDKRAIMLTFLVPIVLISIFAMAFGGAGGGSSVNTIPLLVVDEDGTAQSKEIVKSLDSVKMLDIKHTTNDTALDFIKTGKIAAALFIHKGYGSAEDKMKNIELEYDEGQSQQIGMLQQYLIQTLMNSVAKQTYGGSNFKWQDMMKKFGVDIGSGDSADNNKFNTVSQKIADSIQKSFGGGGSADGKGLKMTSVVKSAQDNVGLVQAVAGTAVMMLLFSLTGMGGRILEEKENGTLKRLLYSPIPPNQILMGKMATSILVACCQLFVMLMFASVAFGLHLWSKIPGVIILVTATAYACSGFGVFLAAIAKSREQQQGLSTLIILSMSAIGGSMIPSFIMPTWMQHISPISINYWSIQGFYDIFWRQLPITSFAFLERVIVLIVIGTGLSIFSFWLFRKNVLSVA